MPWSGKDVPAPGEVTALLTEPREGHLDAAGWLMPLIYSELRSIAASHLRREWAGTPPRVDLDLLNGGCRTTFGGSINGERRPPEGLWAAAVVFHRFRIWCIYHVGAEDSQNRLGRVRAPRSGSMPFQDSSKKEYDLCATIHYKDCLIASQLKARNSSLTDSRPDRSAWPRLSTLPAGPARHPNRPPAGLGGRR